MRQTIREGIPGMEFVMDWRRCDWVEYPPPKGREWTVIAFDRNGQAMLSAKHLTRDEAEELGDKWFARHDVSGVKGMEVEEDAWRV